MPRGTTNHSFRIGFQITLLRLGCALGSLCTLRAGDILRRTGPQAPTSGSGADSTSAGSGVSSTPLNTNAADSLRRASTAIAAVKAMQAAARAAALAASSPNNLGFNPNSPGRTLPDVPDGFASPQIPTQDAAPAGPGLRVAVDANGNPVLWQGASAPVASSSSANQVTVTVSQQQQLALLQWQSFDIGKNTTLTFDQSAGGASASQWIAFNYVRDPSGRPSQILGSLTTINGSTDAQGNPEVGGQVYLINANGIIFGGSSQVNVGALVASSLPINLNLIQRGLLNNPDDQFLFSALPMPAGSNGPTPAFDPSVGTGGIAPVQTPYSGDGTGNAGTVYGDVTVQEGATITAPNLAGSVGGKVALIGPNVTVNGTLSSPDGQVIVAAGLQAGFVAHNSTDASLRGLDVYVGSVDYPSSSNSGTAGSATVGPEGLIQAPEADVSIAGSTVTQQGVITSSTSVSYNGRIDLSAAYGAISSGGAANQAPFFLLKTGLVELGSSSVTEVVPETSDSNTIVGTTLALPSQVNIEGATVSFDGADASRPGALLLAPNAAVTIDAGNWRFVAGGPDLDTGQTLVGTASKFIFDSGQITLQGGSSIDVSGSEDVPASVSQDIISIPLTGTELADSPDQRNGPLRGQTIAVDILENGTYGGVPWVGSPLADTSGYVGLIQRTVGQLTVDGGTVSLNAGAAVNLQAGSSLDVSGGWIDYRGATVQTTKLLTENGQVIDISQATPDQIYEGIYTGTTSASDTKWGATQTAVNPLPLSEYLAGYTQGGNAGSISITAPAMALSGNLYGHSYPGQLQTNPFVPYSSPNLSAVTAAGFDARVWELENQPMTGSLSLVFQGQYLLSGSSNQFDTYSPAPPDIYIQSAASAAPADPRALVLFSDLFDVNALDYSGFGHLAVDNSSDTIQVSNTGGIVQNSSTGEPYPVVFGSITVQANPAGPQDAGITLTPGGSMVLDAGNIDVNGGISAPGGSIKLTAHDFWENSPYDISNFGLPAYNPNRGNFVLSPGVLLSTAGLVVDERAGLSGDEQQTLTQGGSILIAGSDVSIGSQSVLDVDGGAVIAPTGKVTYGAAGSISIQAGSDPSISSLLGGKLEFDSTAQLTLASQSKPLEGYSGAAGGALTLEAPAIWFGTVTSAPSGTLKLGADFPDQGGFGSFTFAGIGIAQLGSSGQPLLDATGNPFYYPGIYVAPETQIYPRVQALEVIPSATSYQTQIISPYSYQTTPVSVTFKATGANDTSPGATNPLFARGDILIGKGSLIETDPQSDSALGVTLSGQTVAVLGSIIVPGGTISITGGSNSRTLFQVDQSEALPTVELGPESYLSTAGTTVYSADPFGNVPGASGYVNTGKVLSGGNITVSGNIVAEQGAVLNVSGWSDANDPAGLLYESPSLVEVIPAQKASLAGAIVGPAVVASNGGSITLTGRQELFVDGILEGAGGGPTATGGTLSVSSGSFTAQNPLGVDLLVTEGGATIPAPIYGSNQDAIGQPVLGTNGSPVSGMGYFTAVNFADGGFASLKLGGTVQFEGPVSITAAGSLTVGTSGIIYADGPVTLSAGYVALGQAYLPPVPAAEQQSAFVSNNSPFYFSPTYGTGTLTVSAGNSNAPGLIDLGDLSLQSIGQASMTAVDGDIRGFGTVEMAGNMTLSAGQVYAPTEEAFTLVAYNYRLPTDASGASSHGGSITFESNGSREPPLSAGSTLNVYAATIDQGGNLEAPIGTINLGWNGSGTAPIDPITNAAVPVTQSLTLESGSTTSVFGAVPDSTTGINLPIPYGLVLSETEWIDPTGTDITSGGLPSKSVTLSAGNIGINPGSVLNTSGGGDLYAYEFVPGTGGTMDILAATSNSFAVIPGFQAVYAPDAANNTAASTGNITNFASGDLGYTSVNSIGANALQIGSQVSLNLNNGQGTRSYTLLPARYALLPGAYLVTPVSSSAILPSQQSPQADGSLVVAGYRYNAFDPSQPLLTEFDVAPSSVVQNHAQYSGYSANTFFGPGASATASSVPVPADAGQLDVVVTQTLLLAGNVSAAPATGGRYGFVDIASPENIVINDTGTGSAPGTLYLDSTSLSEFGAGSILIGGTSTAGVIGDTVNVTTNNLTLDNSGAPLIGADVVLVANENITLAAGAEIEAPSSTLANAENLHVNDLVQLLPGPSGVLNLNRGGTAISFPDGTPNGDTIVFSVNGTITLASGATKALPAAAKTTLAAGSYVTLSGPGTITAGGTGAAIPITIGDGTLVRVSSDPLAQTSRSNVASSTAPVLQVAAGVDLTGGSVNLDSTYSTLIDPTAALSGSVTLSSGKISLVFDSSLSNIVAPNSLVLTGTALASLQSAATALSLLSYSSIDTYGAGQLGSSNFSDLALHAADIRGFQTGINGEVVLTANTITIDNSANGIAPGAAAGTAPEGTLSLNATAIDLGDKNTAINQFSNVAMNASGGIYSQGSGGITTPGNLTMSTSLISGAAGSSESITAGGSINISAAGTAPSSVTGGLGATLAVVGSNITDTASILLPSGTLSLHATGASGSNGNVAISGTLATNGMSEVFNNSTDYTNGGQISLTSDYGNVDLMAGAFVNVSAQAGGGTSGSISISAPNGTFAVVSPTATQPGGSGTSFPTLDGRNGQGTFSLDTSTLTGANQATTRSLSYLEGVLSQGGFSQSQTIRVRTGDVTVDSRVDASTFNLSADEGSIDVTGSGNINASGATGGSIELDASGSVTLESGSQLSVAGENFNDAGEGGAVTLQAGSYTGGITSSPALSRASSGLFAAGAAVVDIQSGSTIDLSVVNDHPLELDPAGSGSITVPAATGVFFPGGTPGNDVIEFTRSGTMTTASGTSSLFAASDSSPFSTSLSPGSTVTMTSTGKITYGGGSGGSIPLSLPFLLADGSPMNIAATNTTDLATYNSTGVLHLTAPQVVNAHGVPYDVQIDPISGSISGASSIVVEGLSVFNLTSSGGVINQAVELAVQNNGAKFAGGVLLAADGTATPVAGNTLSIVNSLTGSNTSIQSLMQVSPGAELVNTNGNLVLSNVWDFAAGAIYESGDPTLAGSWNLSSMPYRFGPAMSAPGFLTIRASGNVELNYDASDGTYGSLNDDFAGYDGADNSSLWQAVMLPTGSKSWSFQLVSGADLSASDARNVLPSQAINPNGGSVLLGLNTPALQTNPQNLNDQIIIPNYFETVRTGTGSVGIYSGGNVELLNNLFSIYTAGGQAGTISNFQEDLNALDPVQYSYGGGNVAIFAQGNIEHLGTGRIADSSKELPMNWLDRRGWVDPTDAEFGTVDGEEISSTSWWVDFENFFEGVGALGGGNVSLSAGGNIVNVDALVPTNERTTYQATPIIGGTSSVDSAATDQTTLELGGGDLSVIAKGNISGGVYYVERGQGALEAGGSIVTNSARTALGETEQLNNPPIVANPTTWLPTTLFLGKGSFSVVATQDLLLGPVANPFLLPQSVLNGIDDKTYFSTYAPSDVVDVSSLAGSITIRDQPDDGGIGNGTTGSLTDYLNQVQFATSSAYGSFAFRSQPWLAIIETEIPPFSVSAGLMPATLRATSFSQDINLDGTLNLSPSATGDVALDAEGSINGVQSNALNFSTGGAEWGSSTINLSNANPASIPGPLTPLAFSYPDSGPLSGNWQVTSDTLLGQIAQLFDESGSSQGNFAVIQTKEELNGPGPIHANDPLPVELYASTGNISGLTLFAGKSTNVFAGQDITDIAFYVENDTANSVTNVVAGRNIVLYDPNSPLRNDAQSGGNQLVLAPTNPTPSTGSPTAGDIQIGGPGTLEVLAGGNIAFGVSSKEFSGTSVGITSIGNTRDPSLPFGGANILVAAGITGLSQLSDVAPNLSDSGITFAGFVSDYLDPATAGANAARYLPELGSMLGITIPADSMPEDIWNSLLAANTKLSPAAQAEQKDLLALDEFYLVLRDAGRDFNDPESSFFGSYAEGYDAIQALFPGSQVGSGSSAGPWSGNISLATRLVETTNGGNIDILAPGGSITVGLPADPQKPDQGILTEDGGNISIFALNDVEVGTSRIFTLHGGNEIIWSSIGNIAAGSGSRTVHAAPPTRVLIDPESADVQNDLAGLATGSGIGVLATLVSVAPGSVDLIAPVGTVDAGDAGIRASGSINIAALHVLNANNIQAGGTTTGVPVVAPPNISGLTSASSATAASSSAANSVAAGQQSSTQTQLAEVPSLIDVEVLGYGGGDDFPT